MKKILMIALVVIAGSYGIVCAQQTKETKVVISDKTGWHKIGESTVNFQTERNEISVLGSDRFASIKFKVTEAPIELLDLEVYFETGDIQNIKVNTNVKAPGESKEIMLNGGERNLKKVVFIYKTLPNRKDVKALVELWGLKTNTDKK